MTDTNKFFTKAELLANKSTTIDIDVPEIGGSVKIRPLTAKEWNMVTARKLRGIKQDVTPARAKAGLMSVDISSTVENEFAGNVLLISYAMAGEKWTEQDAEALPENVFKGLVREIEKAVGLNDKKKAEIDTFRKD